jgi:hypothetical protein
MKSKLNLFKEYTHLTHLHRLILKWRQAFGYPNQTLAQQYKSKEQYIFGLTYSFRKCSNSRGKS